MSTPDSRLIRPSRGNGRLLAGVAAGLSRRWRVNVLLLRAAFVLFHGPALLAYCLLWWFTPAEDRTPRPA